MVTKTDIESREDAMLFATQHIDKLGILINKNKAEMINKIIVKYKEDDQYTMASIDEMGQSTPMIINIDQVAELIWEHRNYINWGQCINIGNGNRKVFLSK